MQDIDNESAVFRSPPFVGRAAEYESVLALLDGARDGHGRLVLIGGEAGIGKTTLVDSVIDHARLEGFTVLVGYCFDLEATPPYGPWVQVLRAVGHAELPPGVAMLAEGGAQDIVGGSEDLQAIVVNYLASLASAQPLLLVLEDMHWSDQESLDLTRALARELSDQPIVVILTYRHVELAPHQPMYRMLPAFARESHVLRLTLRPLDRGAIQDMLRTRARLADSDEARLIDYLDLYAEGIPFYIDELLNTLEYEGVLVHNGGTASLGDLGLVTVPPLIRQIVDNHIARVDERSRELLDIASVIGTEIPLDLWQRVSGEQDEPLIAAIEEAQDARLIEEAPSAGGYRFRHSLIRQAVYEGLILPARRTWHRRIADALEGAPAPDANTLAYHLRQADDPRAVEWLMQAGRDALDLQAPREANRLLGEAIDLAARGHGGIDPEAFLIRGRARATVGDFDDAQSDFERARMEANQSGDRRLEWQTLVELSALWAGRDYSRAGEFSQRALAIAEALADQGLHAHSLNTYGNWLLNTGDPETAIHHHQEALAIFQKTANRSGLVTATSMLAMDYLALGDMVQANSYGMRVVRIVDDRRDFPAYITAVVPVIASHGSNEFDVERALQALETETDQMALAAIESARLLGWRSGEAFVQAIYASTLAIHGEYGEALARAQIALGIAEEIEHREWTTLACIVLGEIHRQLLDTATAKSYLIRAHELARGLNSFIHLHSSAAPYANALTDDGDFQRARQLLTPFLEVEDSMGNSVQRRCWAAMARLANAEGDPQEALAIVDRILSRAPDDGAGRGSPLLRLHRARASAALGNVDEADADLAIAREDAEHFGLRPLLWRTLLVQAELRASRGATDEATALQSQAQKVVEEIAGSLEDDAVRERLVAAVGQKLAGPQAAADTGGLTARELEVLQLVARGMSNSEIADTLFISPRTVNGHLQSIFGKLDVSSRTAAAAYAFEHNLI